MFLIIPRNGHLPLGGVIDVTVTGRLVIERAPCGISPCFLGASNCCPYPDNPPGNGPPALGSCRGAHRCTFNR